MWRSKGLIYSLPIQITPVERINTNSLEYIDNLVGLRSRSQDTRFMYFGCNVLNLPRVADVAKQEKHFCGLLHSAMTSISAAAEAAPQKPLNQSAGCETCIAPIFPRRAWFTSMGHWAFSESWRRGGPIRNVYYVLLDTKGFNLLWIWRTYFAPEPPWPGCVSLPTS